MPPLKNKKAFFLNFPLSHIFSTKVPLTCHPQWTKAQKRGSSPNSALTGEAVTADGISCLVTPFFTSHTIPLCFYFFPVWYCKGRIELWLQKIPAVCWWLICVCVPVLACTHHHLCTKTFGERVEYAKPMGACGWWDPWEKVIERNRRGGTMLLGI